MGCLLCAAQAAQGLHTARFSQHKVLMGCLLCLPCAYGLQDTRSKVLPSNNKAVARYDGGQIDTAGSDGGHDKLRKIGQVVEFPIVAPAK